MEYSKKVKKYKSSIDIFKGLGNTILDEINDELNRDPAFIYKTGIEILSERNLHRVINHNSYLNEDIIKD